MDSRNLFGSVRHFCHWLGGSRAYDRAIAAPRDDDRAHGLARKIGKMWDKLVPAGINIRRGPRSEWWERATSGRTRNEETNSRDAS